MHTKNPINIARLYGRSVEATVNQFNELLPLVEGAKKFMYGTNYGVADTVGHLKKDHPLIPHETLEAAAVIATEYLQKLAKKTES